MGIGPHPHESAHQKKDRDMTPLFDGKSDAELLAIFEPMMDNCLAGSSAIDHAQHVPRLYRPACRDCHTRKSRGAMRQLPAAAGRLRAAGICLPVPA